MAGMCSPGRPSASAHKPSHVRPSQMATISHASVDSWADAQEDTDRAEDNIGFCAGAPQQDIADERDMDSPSWALADKRGFAKVVKIKQCPQEDIADGRDKAASMSGLIPKVADAHQEGGSAE